MKYSVILLAVLILTGIASGLPAEPPEDAGISDQADTQAGPSNQSAVMAEGGLSGLLPEEASKNAVETLNSVDKFLAGIFG